MGLRGQLAASADPCLSHKVPGAFFFAQKALAMIVRFAAVLFAKTGNRYRAQGDYCQNCAYYREILPRFLAHTIASCRQALGMFLLPA